MSTASTNGASAQAYETPRPANVNASTTRVATLGELVGGHPEALRAIFMAGRVTDPAELGDAPRGLFLAMEPTREIHILTKPLMRALAGGVMPWRGKVFDGGGEGRNVVLGRQVVPFAYEVADSDIDGQPALVIRYDRAEHRNPWPIRNIRDELRTVADGVAIGPALFSAAAGGERRVLVWFGLTREK